MQSYDPQTRTFKGVGGNQGRMIKGFSSPSFDFFRARKPQPESQPAAPAAQPQTSRNLELGPFTDGKAAGNFNKPEKPELGPSTDGKAAGNFNSSDARELGPNIENKSGMIPPPVDTRAAEINAAAVQQQAAQSQPQPSAPTVVQNNNATNEQQASTPPPNETVDHKWVPSMLNYWKQGKEGIHT